MGWSDAAREAALASRRAHMKAHSSYATLSKRGPNFTESAHRKAIARAIRSARAGHFKPGKHGKTLLQLHQSAVRSTFTRNVSPARLTPQQSYRRYATTTLGKRKYGHFVGAKRKK